MNIDWDQIRSPRLVLQEAVVKSNIRRMAEKAARLNLRLRPHFKTHQSLEIGSWFLDAGLDRIAVSSVDMAEYFVQGGWNDVFIAFPVNVREHPRIDALARQARLSVLLDSEEALARLAAKVRQPMNIWIEVDVGDGRSGVPWDATERLLSLAESLEAHPAHHWQGLMTHAGHTYAARGRDQILQVHDQAMRRIRSSRDLLASKGLEVREISVGDTPSCSVAEDFAGATEMRPGNFAFYDLMQVNIGSCEEKDIGVALACPVVARYPDRGELVLHGGAVHLGKDFVQKEGGQKVYGRLAWPEGSGWTAPVPGCELASLSQEHGLARVSDEMMEKVQIGDLLVVLPVHSCLAADLMGSCYSAESMASGRAILNRRAHFDGFPNEIAAK